MNRRASIVLSVIALTALAACSSAASPTPAPLAGTWEITSTMGSAVPDAVQPPTATFANGAISGFGGCNTYTGSYTQNGTALTFGPVASTQMFCEGDPSEVEADLFAGLERTASWRMAGTNLEMLDADGTVVLTMTAA